LWSRFGSSYFLFLKLSLAGLKSSINFPVFIGEGVRDKFLDANAEVISGEAVLDFLS
jgi:hypothetical protein